jgi:hypothetical protein
MANPDFEELLNALMPFAQEMLAKNGEFYPFGATMASDGKVNAVSADMGEEQPETQALIDMMIQGFRQEAAAGSLRAAGICVDIRTIPPGQTEKTDAICARLEHSSGEAVRVILPYKKGFLGKYKYGAMFATAGPPEIFAQSGGAV